MAKTSHSEFHKASIPIISLYYDLYYRSSIILSFDHSGAAESDPIQFKPVDAGGICTGMHKFDRKPYRRCCYE